MTKINYSNGAVNNCHIEIWDDLASYSPVAYRAFWVEDGAPFGTVKP